MLWTIKSNTASEFNRLLPDVKPDRFNSSRFHLNGYVRVKLCKHGRMPKPRLHFSDMCILMLETVLWATLQKIGSSLSWWKKTFNLNQSSWLLVGQNFPCKSGGGMLIIDVIQFEFFINLRQPNSYLGFTWKMRLVFSLQLINYRNTSTYL